MEKIRKKSAVFLVLTLLTLAGTIRSAVYKEDLSVGLGYPYISAKYDFGKYAGEIKGAFGSGISIFAGRGYWNFHNADRMFAFTGLEAGYVKFDTEDINGSGWELSPFIGLGAKINDWLTVSADFAPMYFKITSDNTSDSGLEYIVNFGVYIYPFKLSGRRDSRAAAPKYKPVYKPVYAPAYSEEVKKSKTSYKPVKTPKLKKADYEP